jgi:glyceraldehyde-3-phosphate dehydrogenase (NADP+)
MKFIEATIETYKKMDKEGMFKTVGGIYHRIRRAAIGIMLCLGPFNYPFNETYAAFIPALLAGMLHALMKSFRQPVAMTSFANKIAM